MEVLTTALLGVPVLKVIGDVDHLSALALETAVQDALGAHGLRLLSICANVPILIAAAYPSCSSRFARCEAAAGSAS